MRLVASFALALALLGGLASCSREPAASRTAAASAPAPVARVWICPMDKEVVSDKPGSCPKCGMRLELKK